MSFDLIYDGAVPKDYSITLKTEKEGVLGGYILIKKEFYLPNKIIKYIFNDVEIFFKNHPIYTTQIETTNIYDHDCLQAYTNPHTTEFITSDLDILMICGNSKLPMNKVDYNYGMGDILQYEYNIISIINQIFTNEIRQHNNLLPSALIPLISHGPFNRYLKSKLEDICFPLTIYHPTVGKFTLGSETQRTSSLKDFLKICTSFINQGYEVDINHNWINKLC